MKKATSGYIIIKLLRSITKRKTLQSSWRKKDMVHTENKNKDYVRFLIRSSVSEKSVG